MSQIAEVIGRDPALTCKLLNLANSIFFGFSESQPIKSIEEAAFYVGLKQLNDIVISTPVIEEFEKLSYLNGEVSWKEFWIHSIGTAILTREVLSLAEIIWEDESDYIAGLLHNVGKIIIACVYPDEFSKLLKIEANSTLEFSDKEKELIHWDHAKIGAYYLWKNHLAPEIIESVQNHNTPKKALKNPELAAAIQIADHLIRTAGVKGIENIISHEPENCQELEGFDILFGHMQENQQQESLSALMLTKDRIAMTVKEMV
jgi:HD-like signal output (HDOD) protein